MSDVVEQDGQLGTAALLVGYLHAFLFQHLEGTTHKVEGAEHVAEPRVHGSGIDQIGQPQLLDAPLTLEIRMVNHTQNHRVVDAEETIIHRVVDYLALGHNDILFLDFSQQTGGIGHHLGAGSLAHL